MGAIFFFAGGGLISGFKVTPPATYVDGGCEQVLVYTFSSDASGNFHQRFYSQPNLSMAALDISDSDTGYLGGFIIDSVNNPPVARCQNVTVSAGANCTAPASIDNSSSDPDGDPITLTQTPAGPYSLGTTTVTLTVTDNHGASSTCTATVTVVDTTPPVITGCPANIIVQTGPGRTTCDQVATWTRPPASDNCSLGISTSSRLPGGTFPVGTTTVTYMASDGAGNKSFCSFTVTVELQKDLLP